MGTNSDTRTRAAGFEWVDKDPLGCDDGMIIYRWTEIDPVKLAQGNPIGPYLITAGGWKCHRIAGPEPVDFSSGRPVVNGQLEEVALGKLVDGDFIKIPIGLGQKDASIHAQPWAAQRFRPADTTLAWELLRPEDADKLESYDTLAGLCKALHKWSPFRYPKEHYEVDTIDAARINAAALLFDYWGNTLFRWEAAKKIIRKGSAVRNRNDGSTADSNKDLFMECALVPVNKNYVRAVRDVPARSQSRPLWVLARRELQIAVAVPPGMLVITKQVDPKLDSLKPHIDELEELASVLMEKIDRSETLLRSRTDFAAGIHAIDGLLDQYNAEMIRSGIGDGNLNAIVAQRVAALKENVAAIMPKVKAALKTTPLRELTAPARAETQGPIGNINRALGLVQEVDLAVSVDETAKKLYDKLFHDEPFARDLADWYRELLEQPPAPLEPRWKDPDWLRQLEWIDDRMTNSLELLRNAMSGHESADQIWDMLDRCGVADAKISGDVPVNPTSPVFAALSTFSTAYKFAKNIADLAIQLPGLRLKAIETAATWSIPKMSGLALAEGGAGSRALADRIFQKVKPHLSDDLKARIAVAVDAKDERSLAALAKEAKDRVNPPAALDAERAAITPQPKDPNPSIIKKTAILWGRTTGEDKIKGVLGLLGFAISVNNAIEKKTPLELGDYWNLTSSGGSCLLGNMPLVLKTLSQIEAAEGFKPVGATFGKVTAIVAILQGAVKLYQDAGKVHAALQGDDATAKTIAAFDMAADTLKEISAILALIALNPAVEAVFPEAALLAYVLAITGTVLSIMVQGMHPQITPPSTALCGVIMRLKSNPFFPVLAADKEFAKKFAELANLAQSEPFLPRIKADGFGSFEKRLKALGFRKDDIRQMMDNAGTIEWMRAT